MNQPLVQPLNPQETTPVQETEAQQGTQTAGGQEPASPERLDEQALIWQRTLIELAATMTPANYRTWFDGTQLVDLNLLEAVVSAPSQHQREWLQTRWEQLVSKALATVLGRRVGVRIVAV